MLRTRIFTDGLDEAEVKLEEFLAENNIDAKDIVSVSLAPYGANGMDSKILLVWNDWIND